MENNNTIALNKNSIESTINLIDNELMETKAKMPENVKNDLANNEFTINDLIEVAIDNIKKVDKKTDELYDMFYGPLATRQDRSDASKIAILDTQHVKTDMLQAIAQLANAKAREEAAKQKNNALGIIVQTNNGKDVGIDLSNLQ